MEEDFGDFIIRCAAERDMDPLDFMSTLTAVLAIGCHGFEDPNEVLTITHAALDAAFEEGKE